MISYLLFFEDFEESDNLIGDITPKMIYTFYYLEKMMISHDTPEVRSASYKFINQLKSIYLETFSTLLIDQLKKYQARKRVDPDFTMGSDTSPPELARLMRKTFRSDMKRRNDLWIICADSLVGLSESKNINTAILYIDRLNTCVHNARNFDNTNESMFAKLKSGGALVEAMDVCKNFRNERAYLQYISKDYKDLYPKGSVNSY